MYDQKNLWGENNFHRSEDIPPDMSVTDGFYGIHKRNDNSKKNKKIEQNALKLSRQESYNVKGI